MLQIYISFYIVVPTKKLIKRKINKLPYITTYMKITKEMGCYFSSNGALTLDEKVPSEVVRNYRNRVLDVQRGRMSMAQPNLLYFLVNIKANNNAKRIFGIPANSNLEYLLKELHKENGEIVEGLIGNYTYGNRLGHKTYDAWIKNVSKEEVTTSKSTNVIGMDYKFELVLMEKWK